MERFWKKVNKTEGCWEWTGKIKIGKSGGGYGIVTVSDPSRGFKNSGQVQQRDIKAHRMSWELTYGPIPKGLVVCHKCDNRKCVRPDHLFVGTQADNIRDMYAKGREARGAKVSNFGPKNGFYGRKHSEESLQKMRLAKRKVSS